MRKTIALMLVMLVMCATLIGCTQDDPLANAEVENTNETTEIVLPEN